MKLSVPARAGFGPLVLPALAALALGLVPTGCGVLTPDSTYVPMQDGTPIAVDVWLPLERPPDGRMPAVLRLGRYWRDYNLPFFLEPFLGRYPEHVSWLNEAGYVVVMVDVRGTGASFGVSLAPWSPQEIADYPTIVDWVIAQPWSDGRVGAYGVSYDGVTSDWLGAARHPAVHAILPLYSYSDVYLDVSHPGGLLNDRFLKAWGDLTYAMDRNNPDFLEIMASADPSGLVAEFLDVMRFLLTGVEPVQFFGIQLTNAVLQHAANAHVYEVTRQITFRDDEVATFTADRVSPLLGSAGPQRDTAIRRVVGWQDAGSARGALRAFNTLETDFHVVVIAPHSHTGSYYIDPYIAEPPAPIDPFAVIAEVWEAVPFFDGYLRDTGASTPGRWVAYYTYVDRVWNITPVWPPEGFERQTWYFAADHALQRDLPTSPDATDFYVVDFSATTGAQNRWFTGLGGLPIYYPDRAAQDQKLLVYDTPPLERDTELTGHPVVTLYVASTLSDGAFYVYLEDVFPDGRVAYLTEGQLRGLHRRISAETPPAAGFGPYHSYKRADALPLVEGEVAELAFDLLPISTVIRAGHRIRVAVAGHDADTFQRVPAEGTPAWTVHRNGVHASRIEIPLRER